MKRLRNMIALLISALVLSMSFSSSVRDAQHPQVLLTRAYASVDASTAWNSVCANYEFPNTASVPSGYTFLQAWNMRMTHTQTFDDAFVSARLDEFAAHHDMDAESRRALGREFDLVTVQRKLKDAGRFVFIEHKKGDPSYLRFVEPTIAKVRRALARLRGEPRLDDLALLLDRIAG